MVVGGAAAPTVEPGPPFVCQELHSDPLLFDIYARTLQRGGVMYRDACETNLPGMTWLHWGLRSALGWRSETLRAVDLIVLGSILLLLAPGSPLWRPAGGSASLSRSRFFI